MPEVRGPDYVLALEFSLLGSFAIIREPLLFLRDNRGGRAQPGSTTESRKAFLERLYPGERNPGGRFPHARHTLEGLRVVRRARLGYGQKAAKDVDIVQGDWLVLTEGLRIPRAVEIDVEGYEYSALRGLQKALAHPACELLCCEIHPSFMPPGVDAAVFVEFVKSLGFTQIDVFPPPPPWTSVHMVAAKREPSDEAP